MPIQEEEKASGKPAAKARPILQPSSTSGWDFTPTEQRQWTDIETRESRDPHCFQVSSLDCLDTVKKLIEKMMEQSTMTKLLLHARKINPTMQDIGQMKKHFVNAQHWSIEKWVSVPARGGGHKKRFQYCLNPSYPHQFLYLRAIQGHSGSTINPALQDNVLLPEGFTECFYHVGNGNELISLVNHGLIPGGVSFKTGRHAVFFTVVNPMDNQDGLGETVCHL